MAKLSKDECFAILSEEISTKVKLDEGKDSGSSVFRLVPTALHPDALRWIIRAGYGRIHGQKLNTVSVAGGAKVEEFAKVNKLLRDGVMPDLLEGATRQSLDDVESIMADLWIADFSAKPAVRKAVKGAGLATGKRGDSVTLPDVIAWAATQNETKALTRAAGDGFVWDKEAIAANGKIAAAWKEKAEEEHARRLKEQEEQAEAVESESVKEILSGLI